MNALSAIILVAGIQAGDIERRAIEYSQGALGGTVAEAVFIDAHGRRLSMAELRGKPLVISMVFTACAHSCSISTRHLDRIVRIARGALGHDAFTLLTIGFDQPVDTPEAMRHYATRHGVTDLEWLFLSFEDAGDVAPFAESLGFLYTPSPRGFDHTVQVTIIDREGLVFRQVYGEFFNTPLLVEPLKSLVLGVPAPEDSFLTQVGNRVRLFCTVYDARGDRYYFDYSLFAGIFIGVLFLGSTMVWLAWEFLGRRPRREA